MSFDSWQAFWDMGGYGLFVWPSYALTFITLLALVAHAVRRHGRLQQELQRLERLQQRERKSP